MKLIPNWRDGWKFWSVRVQAIGILILLMLEQIPDVVYSAWEALPTELQSLIPDSSLKIVAYAALIGGIVARLLYQESLHSDDSKMGD